MSEKTRTLTEPIGSYRYTEDGKTWKDSIPTTFTAGKQRTVSEGHPINPSTGFRDGGGPFYSTLAKRTFRTTRVHVKGISKATANQRLEADVGTPLPDAKLPTGFNVMAKAPETLRPEDLSDLDADGATAISLVSPTNPNSNAATMLGEIAKDGMSSLPGIRTWRSRTDYLRHLGDEYLNVEFGWKPLISDVRGVSSSIKNRHAILQQYERDSGSNVRREFEFPVERRSEELPSYTAVPSVAPTGATGWPILGGLFGSNTVNLTLVEESRKWFSGCFTYTTPPSNDSRRKMAYSADQAQHLLGVSLTPNVLWELTPWSWAVDWFSNAGNVINNFTNFALQGLVMRYGYIMNERSIVVTASFSSKAPTAPAVINSAPPQTYEIRVKSRAPANPFGFGIGWEDLSPTQLAITAALGISRVRL